VREVAYYFITCRRMGRPACTICLGTLSLASRIVIPNPPQNDTTLICILYLGAGLGAAPDRRMAALQLSSRRPPRVLDQTVHAAKAFSAACSPLLKLSSVHM
jgi:hypothetical protein